MPGIVGIIALGLGILMRPVCVNAAESDSITDLLKALNVSGYAAPQYPPGFSTVTIDNKKISLVDLRGRVLLLNFWATWCLECRSEMPMFERLHREFSTQGLSVIGVNARERISAIRLYAKELGLTFPLLPDPAGKINSDYGVIGLPTTFLVRRDGRAAALAVGPRDWNGKVAHSLIQALLAKGWATEDARHR